MVENPEKKYFFSTGRYRTCSDSEEVKHGVGFIPSSDNYRGFERILKIGQYLTKLCADHSCLLFLPTLYIYTDVIYRTPLSCMPEFLISAITCNRASVASEKIFEKMREEDDTMQILAPKVAGEFE